MRAKIIALSVVIAVLAGCGGRGHSTVGKPSGDTVPMYFSLGDGGRSLITISPFNGSRDTFLIEKPLSRLVCMSTSYIGFLEEIGSEEAVAAVSGGRFSANPYVRSHALEAGYDAAPDYETILSCEPDLVVTYSVSPSVPQFVTYLRSLGVPVLILSEHLESHPLARAAYVKLFGALVGREAAADSAYAVVEAKYMEITSELSRSKPEKVRVLVNIPYGDQWFVPGGGNFFSTLVSDAGGEVLGAEEGAGQSSVIGVEKAFSLSSEADVWLNPGMCRTRKELAAVNPLFKSFPVFGKRIYNNILRTGEEGGNDFWESGAMHPELILEDLAAILHPEVFSPDNLNYYLEVK